MSISSRLAWPLCLSLAVAAGCDGGTPASSPHPPLPPRAGDATGQLQWRGLLACADCDGIDMQLQLVRDDAPHYELVELFLVGRGEERFQERGLWTREGRFLRLQADDGAERVFAIEADGRLSVRGRDGEMPPGPPGLLEPVTPHPRP